MVYDSFLNQLYHLIHYVFAFLLIGYIAPYFIFKKTYTHATEQVIANYIRSIFVVIILGYILVLAKLYEVISLVLIYFVILILTHKESWNRVLGEQSIFRVLFRVFDMLDGLVFFDRTAGKRVTSSTLYKVKHVWKSWWSLKNGLRVFLLIVVFGYSAIIRFKDALTHATPPMTDSYVTLSWMKYINERILFHDGIYPQGFHIVLATLLKFAAIDALYVLKYTGPLDTMIIVFGLYYFIGKTTGNFFSGLIGATVYGLGNTVLFSGDVGRQIATNSQEFSFSFIFLSLYFLIAYVVDERRENLIVGMLGTSIIGLVHSLGYAYIGFAIMVLILANFFVKKRKAWKSSIYLVLSSLMTVVLSLLPLIIGLVMHRSVHSSSASYLTSESQSVIPLQSLHVLDYLSLFCMPFLLIFSLKSRTSLTERLTFLFVTLFGVFMFLVYYTGGHITGSLLISGRASDLWALTVPVIIGMGSYAIGRLSQAGIKVLLKKQLPSVVAWCAGFIVVASLIIGFHPGTIEAYKMERDSSIEQYLKIKTTHTAQNWMIVSNSEGYAVVLGSGVHMYLSTFVKRYDPTKPGLTVYGNSKPDHQVPSDVYVFNEVNVYEVSKSLEIYSILKPEYQKRISANTAFENWLKVYKSDHHKFDVYYKSPDFIVYHFHIPKPPSNKVHSLFGLNNN